MSIALKPEDLKPQNLKPAIPPPQIPPEPPQPESPPKRRFPKWLLGSIALLAVMGVGYLAYRQFVLLPQQQAKNKVQTAPVERSNLTITVTANGTVQPERSVNVSPKSAGILKQLLVKEGDAVEQGQILAYMDDSNLQGQLRQATPVKVSICTTIGH